MLDLSMQLHAAQGRDLCGVKALWQHTGDAEVGSCNKPVPSIAGADTSETTYFLACRARVVCHGNKIILLFFFLFLVDSANS